MSTRMLTRAVTTNTRNATPPWRRLLSASSSARSVEFARIVDASADEAKSGGMSLLELSMSHVGQARSQKELVAELEQNGVLKSKVLRKAMVALDRALFVPVQQDAAVYAEPYANAPQKLHAASGATLSTPHHHCVVGEAMAAFLEDKQHHADEQSQPVRFLDIGAGTGYLTVLVAEMMHDLGLLSAAGAARSPQAVGTDAVPALVAHACDKAASRCTSETASQTLRFVDAFDEAGRPVLDCVGSDEKEQVGFDLVHAGFAFPLESPLGTALIHDALRPGGRLVASLALPGDAQELVMIDKSASTGELTKTILARNMHCQAQLAETFDEVAATKSRADLLDEVRRDLDAWKATFESEQGRKPSRDDMMTDAHAATLFKRFAALRQGAWDK